MKIYQFLETFSDADAIGYQVLGIDRFLKMNGIETAIYANNIDQKCVSLCEHFSKHLTENDDSDIVYIYHHSIGSDIFEYLKKINGKKLLVFHNITPPSLF